MSKQITVVDASVLITAAIGPDAARRMRALSVIGDPNREFASTRYLQLEVLPIPTRYQKHKERQFYDRFFGSVVAWLDEASLIQPAIDLACRFGLGAMDALHLASAMSVNAEFISAEKPTKPIYQAWQNIFSIY
jgi:predicted nucleic acid-binding protein